MVYKKQQGIALRLVNEFWKYNNDSYTIERMYKETENVLVTLSDHNRNMHSRFIFYRANKGIGVRILDTKGYYLANLWRKGKKDIGGTCEGALNSKGENGKDAFNKTLYLLKRAINLGSVEMEVERSPFPPSIHIPLSERESSFLDLFHKGLSQKEICERLSIKESKALYIRSALLKKGITCVDEKYGPVEEVLDGWLVNA